MGSPEPPAGTALLGRGAERNLLGRLLTRTATGRGQMAVLEGEAGIGKTSLVLQTLATAHRRGFTCLVASAEELERHRPFGAIAQALGVRRRAWSGPGDQSDPGGTDPSTTSRQAGLARMLSGDTGDTTNLVLSGAPEGEFRIVDAIIDLVEHCCAQGPVLVGLEDLQWADPSTLLALDRLGREIAHLPVLLVLTARPLPRSPELAGLLAALAGLGASQVGLGRLAEETIAQLAQRRLGARPGERLLEQLARAGGNPFFATEVLAWLERDGAISRIDGRAETPPPGPGGATGADGQPTVPTTLRTTILHRLNFLTPPARETLQVASILGSTFSLAELAAVVGRPIAEVRDELRSAVRGGVLQEDALVFSFRHDLIQEALYHEMPSAIRIALHLSAATALLEQGLPADEVAEHVMRGAVPGDMEAVEWLRMAAGKASARSPKIAAELLGRALELVPPEHHLRDALLAELAVHLLVSGRLAEAEAVCCEALSRDHDPAVEGNLRLCLVQAFVAQGRVAESLEQIDQAVKSPALTDQERARLWGWSSTCRVILWDLDLALAHAELALKVCRAIEDDLGTTIALAGMAAVRSLQGHGHEALSLGDRALAAARTSRSPQARRLQLTLMRSLMLFDLDRLEEAQHDLRRGRFARERRGARWNLPTYHYVSAMGRFHSGEWDEAIAQFDSASDFAEEVIVYQAQLAGHSTRSLIALHRGDMSTAEREAAAAEATARTSGPQWRPDWMMWARALLAEAAGREADALRLLAKAWELCRGAGVVAEFPVIGPDLVRLALGAGETILAEEVAEAVGALAARAGVPSITGAALRCQAMVQPDPAVSLAAVAAYRASPRPRELALACEDAAFALAESGRLPEARPLAEEALQIYRGLDARRDTNRASARFRSVGLRSGSRGERARPKSGWLSLTEAEMAVAMHIYEGLSNPEIARRLFISRRTVQSHVSHALKKLGLSSRVELAVETARWLGGNAPVEPAGSR